MSFQLFKYVLFQYLTLDIIQLKTLARQYFTIFTLFCQNVSPILQLFYLNSDMFVSKILNKYFIKLTYIEQL